MTISYQFEVASSTFCGFAKLLKKWRGSVYKLVFKEMLVYAAAYALLSMLYRLAMAEQQKRVFEKICLHCAKYLDLIPLSFVLGFYVTFIVQRWWNQFTTIPWPDRTMNTLLLYVQGSDDRGRMIRRTMMRYLNLSVVLILSSISVAVKKRFPTLDHLVSAGFMTDEEKHLFSNVKTKVNRYWVPMCWFINLLEEARKEGRVRDGAPIKHIMEELNDLRSRCSLLWCFDWVTVPLVYTQVVTWATHLFFIACLFGRQMLDPEQNIPGHEIDIYIPIFTLLQFFFYLGWLKVAEQLINPFGEDDDDFEINWLIDRHIQVSYLGVDDLYGKVPTIGKDIFWNKGKTELPYTAASLIHKIPAYSGSTMHLKIPEKEQQQLVYMASNSTSEPDGDHGNNSSPSDGLLEKIGFRPPRKQKPAIWKRMSLRNSFRARDEEAEDQIQKVRSLGKRESLLPDNFLAMLNAGRRKLSSRGSVFGSSHFRSHGPQSDEKEMDHVVLTVPTYHNGSNLQTSASFVGSQQSSDDQSSLFGSSHASAPFLHNGDTRHRRPSFPRVDSTESAITFQAPDGTHHHNRPTTPNEAESAYTSPSLSRFLSVPSGYNQLQNDFGNHLSKGRHFMEAPHLSRLSETENEDCDSSPSATPDVTHFKATHSPIKEESEGEIALLKSPTPDPPKSNSSPNIELYIH